MNYALHCTGGINIKLSAIGIGHMGMTVLDCLVGGGLADPSQVLVYDIKAENISTAQTKGYNIASNAIQAYSNCEYLLLGVLPQNCEELLAELSGAAHKPSPVVISIVSGVGSAKIQRYLNPDTQVILVVPNLGLALGCGATALSCSKNTPPALFDRIVGIFSSYGEASVVDEPKLKDIIAANGCAPGYAFYFIHAIASAVADHGIDYEQAALMTAKAFEGAATMVLAKTHSPQELCQKVCSPGGLTVQAIQHFDSIGLTQAIAEAVGKSIQRGYDLAKEEAL